MACCSVSVPLIVVRNGKLDEIIPIREINNIIVVIIDIG